MNLEKVITIIPARYQSSRFPGKPLADMKGKPMIQRVVERAKELNTRVVVATDDERIYNCVKAFGGEVVMTKKEHQSGTLRCIEAFQNIGQGEEFLLNLQGDEPFIQINEIKRLIECFNNPNIQIATLAEIFPQETSNEELNDPNKVKVVCNKEDEALYFSRSTIPYIRDEQKNLCAKFEYLRHVGIYAFRTNILDKILNVGSSKLSELESLEQLAWLDSGMKIALVKTKSLSIGIDTEDDLQTACKLL